MVNLIATDLDNGQAGTGTTAPSINDTALVTPIAASKVALTKEIGNQTIACTHVISSGIATGNDFTEWSLRMNSDGTMATRTTTAPVTHTASDEITRITTIFVNQK